MTIVDRLLLWFVVMLLALIANNNAHMRKVLDNTTAVCEFTSQQCGECRKGGYDGNEARF